ncbi:MAG: thiolase family protein [Euryarchaeota archaeon]|jgi:acetyl-CoA C-acetyltransferase|nr:thiolase family protein [Euryarchaeota archaeon]MBT6644932.1 thiolase family protein [Euryarchaeota archaeon]
MSEADVVICAVARTPVGRFRGALRNYSAVDLGVMAVKELLQRVDIDPTSGVVDELLFGQVLQAGAGQAPARQVALGAGLPSSIPCTTINKVCGSGLKTVMFAANSIRAGEYEVLICGGMESMTNSPHLAWGVKRGKDVPFDELEHSMVHDGLWDVYDDVHMGNTGETVASDYQISRNDSDEFSVRSHTLANQAWENGWMGFEAFSVNGINRDGEAITLEVDEGIRVGTDMERLSGLSPVFTDDGQVTAGNASQLSDGAAAVLVASRRAAIANGWPILAVVLDQETSGLEPSKVMAAPIPAVEAIMQRNDLQVSDIDMFEHNEAFASASCAVAKALEIPDEKFNPHGGAVAIGHPLGASGTRCLMALINALRRIDDGKDDAGRKGIVTLCLGGGNAVAMLVQTE